MHPPADRVVFVLSIVALAQYPSMLSMLGIRPQASYRRRTVLQLTACQRGAVASGFTSSQTLTNANQTPVLSVYGHSRWGTVCELLGPTTMGSAMTFDASKVIVLTASQASPPLYGFVSTR